MHNWGLAGDWKLPPFGFIYLFYSFISSLSLAIYHPRLHWFIDWDKKDIDTANM